MTPKRIHPPADAVNTSDKPRPDAKGESIDMGVSRPVRLSDRLRRGRRGRAAVRPAGSHLSDFVIITGFSGAGKSTAMAVFEDAGYFCVDNLPPEMIRSLTELFMHEGSKVECAAIVSDVRGGDYFDDLAAVLEELDRADTVVDTSGLTAVMLRRKLAEEVMVPDAPAKLAVTFASYGHKHGPMRDADLAFDVRFLPNPHYEVKLRPLTGLDERVVDYIGRDGALDEFYARLVPLLDYLLPLYLHEGKAHLMVGIGCTGGRHRSVAIAEHLARHYREHGSYTVGVSHRDIDKPPRG